MYFFHNHAESDEPDEIDAVWSKLGHWVIGENQNLQNVGTKIT